MLLAATSASGALFAATNISGSFSKLLFWLTISEFIAALLIGAVYVGVYLFFLRNKNIDALRSETYSLQKLAIEHGLFGDSDAGIIDKSSMLDLEMLPKKQEKDRGEA